MDSSLSDAIRLEDAGNFPAAAAIYQSLAGKGDASAAFNLAYLYLRCGHISSAAQLFDQLIQRNLNDADALRGLAHCRIDAARVSEGVDLFRRAGSESEALFYLLHLSGDPSAAHRRWAESFPPRPARKPAWDGIRPLRVGYVGVGIVGTVARFLNPVLEAHDPAAVRAFTYGRPSLRELEADNLDVVVDLLGHMARGVNLPALAVCTAPLLCSYIGYPCATGLPGQLDLDGCGWAYRSDGIDLTPSPFKANGFITFGSINRACKITPKVASAWGAILRLSPMARLVVLAPGGENNSDVRNLLASGGAPMDRITLTPQTHRADYIQLINSIDIALDCWPYNGMTTTCDALWQGVPVLTMAGESARQRAGASVLKTCGLEDWVVTSPAEYIDKAARFARCCMFAKDWTRGMIRQHLLPLLDGRRAAMKLELTWSERLE